ncbi:MAG: TonB-dependent receptor domain-containing protein [Runella sp.]
MKKTIYYQPFWGKIMRLTLFQAFFTLAFIGSVVANPSNGQDLLERSISIQIQERSITEALNLLEKAAEVKFVYSPVLIQSNRRVTLSVQNEKLSNVLNKMLLPLGVSYKPYGNQIILSMIDSPMTSPKAEPAVMVAPVEGKVKSAKGESMPGVNVAIKGTTRGTITDSEGNFKINADVGETLVFSFIGFESKEIKIADTKTPLAVVLNETSSALSEIVVVGSRAAPRTDVDRPVPVDIITSKELQSTGQIEIGQMVQFTSPSFNSAKTGVNGVANYADPATLRGLSPDQVLVLVDGKRRHQFSGLNLNVTVGLGTVVTDMNAIPSLAVDRIEVLRDGAAAQYGSDAIAGIVNIGLNRSVGKGTFKTQYGITKEGDGATYLGAFNYGFKLGKDKSYLNVSLQYQHADGTNRSDNYVPRPVEGGAYTGIYSNTPATDEATRRTRGIWPEYGTFRVGIYGSNQTTAYQGFYNLGYPLAKNWNLYSFGGVSFKDVKAYGFFRVATPTNANSNPDIFPDGYTPELPGTTRDYSTVVGINRKLNDGWSLDFSAGYGYNNLDMWAQNTTNPSMGKDSPTSFYVGQNAFGQTTFEANASRNYKGLMGTKSFNVALGSQYRIDNFILKQGSPESYFVGPLALQRNKLPGSSGRPGIAPADETNATRSNIGFYADVESDITDKFLLTGALRYENYSDFGSNISGKLASRLKLGESFSLRGSINRGFRAPSLAQTFNSVTTSTVQAGAIIQTKQLPNNDPRLKQIGVEDPTAETSWNYSVGITAKAGNKFLFTLDAYQIDIKDRIILAERMIVNQIAALRPLFPGISEIRFFTNHVNTTTKGIDFVTTFKHDFNSKNRFNASLALTFNETKITSQRPTPAALQAGTTAKILVIDTVSISLIETAQPRQKMHLSLSYQANKVNFTWRTSYFGPVTAWEKPAGRPHITQTFSGKTLHDVAITYTINKMFTFSVGSNNVTNVYPDRVARNFAGYSNGQIPFTRNANQFGFNGAFYYANATVNF